MNTPALAALADALGERRLLFDEPMSKYTSFRIGGPTELFVDARDSGDIACCTAYAEQAGCALRFIGNGTNLLVADEGLPGLTVRIGRAMSGIVVSDELLGILRVSAGTSNAKIAAVARDAGLSGYEFAAGIPGSAGGAVIMNAGAYGGQFSDVCRSVEVMHLRSGEIERLSASDIVWGYRESSLAAGDGDVAILSVELGLEPGHRPGEISETMREMASKRRDSQPHMPSAGSTFTRTADGVAASWLIDRAGLKGTRVGAAMVSEAHAGFIVNMGGAIASDVRRLMNIVQEKVLAVHGVELEPEVKMLGFPV